MKEGERGQGGRGERGDGGEEREDRDHGANPQGSSTPSTLCSNRALFIGLLCIIYGGAHER